MVARSARLSKASRGCTTGSPTALSFRHRPGSPAGGSAWPPSPSATTAPCIEAAADRLDGLVVAAFGVGHVPAGLVPLLAGIAARIPVVVASRTGAGTTLRAAYAYQGSERDLLDHGLIGSGFLDPLKARILLHSLLTASADRSTITAAFDVAGGYAEPGTWPWPPSQPR